MTLGNPHARQQPPKVDRLFRALLEIAHAATQIGNPRNKAYLFEQRGVCAGSWKHVADLSDFTLYCRVVDFLAKHLTGFVRQRPYIRAKQARNGCYNEFAVADVETKRLKVTVFEAALTFVERRQRFLLVRLH